MGWNPFKMSVRNTAGKRKTYRANVSGLHIKLVGRPTVYSARDISPTGLGINGATGLRVGQIIELGLFLKGSMVVSGIKGRVVRVSDAFTGLVFENTDPRKTDAIHALVLKELKRQADSRNKGGDKLPGYYDMNF